jgi:hypothetical protein
VPGAHRPRQEPAHPGVALELGHVLGVLGADPDLGDEARHGRKGDARLAEGGQDLLDVAEEQRVGSDHQDALALQGETVRVEEVGGPVEGDGRLSRSRTALHEEDSGQR